MTDPIDAVELMNSLGDMAKLTRKFFKDLVEEGFTEGQALTLTVTWLNAISSPRSDA